MGVFQAIPVVYWGKTETPAPGDSDVLKHSRKSVQGHGSG
ncbi:hypothetical protein NIES2104_32570 [Leptolyngbya sp. NIES-2104]|nr:hypothetical protein NIES2104_32570 [Leptolyngbya sp. NIES-2104]